MDVSFSIDAFIQESRQRLMLPISILLLTIPIWTFFLLQFEALASDNEQEVINVTLNRDLPIYSIFVYQSCRDSNFAIMLFCLRDLYFILRGNALKWFIYLKGNIQVKCIPLKSLEAERRAQKRKKQLDIASQSMVIVAPQDVQRDPSYFTDTSKSIRS